MTNTNKDMRSTFMTPRKKQGLNNFVKLRKPNFLMIKTGCILSRWMPTFNKNSERCFEDMPQHLLIQGSSLPKREKNRIAISN
ncbi:hypothetical protein KR52_06755 [Synechococcus sp. KORDI-52]|nr:hypothetical protein KR52_06755 [Synechococcus sp. KORDI-52]